MVPLGQLLWYAQHAEVAVVLFKPQGQHWAYYVAYFRPLFQHLDTQIRRKIERWIDRNHPVICQDWYEVLLNHNTNYVAEEKINQGYPVFSKSEVWMSRKCYKAMIKRFSENRYPTCHPKKKKSSRLMFYIFFVSYLQNRLIKLMLHKTDRATVKVTSSENLALICNEARKNHKSTSLMSATENFLTLIRSLNLHYSTKNVLF